MKVVQLKRVYPSRFFPEFSGKSASLGGCAFFYWIIEARWLCQNGIIGLN